MNFKSSLNARRNMTSFTTIPSRTRSSGLMPSKPLKYTTTYMSLFNLDSYRPPSKRFKDDPSYLYEIQEEHKETKSKNPEQVIKENSPYLTEGEIEEIRKYPEIYYIGKSQKKHNGVYDDEKNYYRTFIGDQIAYRYEILHIIGDGSFGIVVSCFDHKTNTPVAIKILRKGKIFKENGELEVASLNELLEGEKSDIIIEKFCEFMFRDHFCIVFELLSKDLYQFMKQNHFRGLPTGVIRRIAIQTLMGLKHIHSLGFIHCDLKPENILFRASQKSGIKIIDFGSACKIGDRRFVYIQSRFYRAPEVILELDFNEKIDIWSLGCILFELYTGTPVFMGEDDVDQLCKIIETLGEIPAGVLKASPRTELFDEQFRLVRAIEGRIVPGSNRISSQLDKGDSSFVDFLNECFKLDHSVRMSAEAALNHPWVKGGRAKELKASKTFHKSVNNFDS